LVTGLAAMQLVGVSIRSIPASISGGISSGTLEALLATPASMPQLLAGMTGYGMLWATAKAATLILGIVIFGGAIALKGLPLAILILVLLVLAHLPLGLLLASGVLVFRTTGPIGPTVMGAFGLLGGVYYSTSVIPEVVRPLASLVPLTYGLRAFRRALLSGDSFSAVAVDLECWLSSRPCSWWWAWPHSAGAFATRAAPGPFRSTERALTSPSQSSARTGFPIRAAS